MTDNTREDQRFIVQFLKEAVENPSCSTTVCDNFHFDWRLLILCFLIDDSQNVLYGDLFLVLAFPLPSLFAVIFFDGAVSIIVNYVKYKQAR